MARQIIIPILLKSGDIRQSKLRIAFDAQHFAIAKQMLSEKATDPHAKVLMSATFFHNGSLSKKHRVDFFLKKGAHDNFYVHFKHHGVEYESAPFPSPLQDVSVNGQTKVGQFIDQGTSLFFSLFSFQHKGRSC